MAFRTDTLIKIAVLTAIALAFFAALAISPDATPATAAAAAPSGGDLAAQLTAKGWTLYGSKTCGWTQRQMKDFGDAASSLAYVECSGGAAKCAGIEGFPTWKNDSGDAVTGYRTQAQLRAMLA